MTERFLLEHNEAASTIEAAFILDQKSGLRVRIIRFRTLKQLDAYQPSGIALRVRTLPILLEASETNLTERNQSGILNRMANWYYHTQLNRPAARPVPVMPPPADTGPGPESAD